MTTLYSYWRSSAAYRVRIALNLKGVPYDIVPVHLVRGGVDGGPAHRAPAYAAINPQMRVPALETDDGDIVIQSPAILEWLEETHPAPALLPADALGRARVRAVVNILCCDVHPLNNSGTIAELRRRFGADDAAIASWIAHWITDGLAAVEKLIDPAPFAFGAAPSLADVVLTPVLYSARRFSVPLERFRKVAAADAAMQGLEAVRRAAPAAQPDAE